MVMSTDEHQVRPDREAMQVVDMTDQMHPQEPAPPGPSGAPFVVSDVYLLTADSNGQVAVPGLSLVIDATGLTVHRPDGVVAAVVAWSDMTELVASRRMRTPAGNPGIVVETTTASRSHRFVVPTDDPDSLERDFTRFAAEAGVGKGGRRAGRAHRRSWWKRGSRAQSSPRPEP